MPVLPLVKKFQILVNPWHRNPLLPLCALLALWCSHPLPGLTQLKPPAQPKPMQVTSLTCPQDFTALTTRLLQDLPSYINRVRIRSGITKSYIMVAARPEFEPLPLATVPALPPEQTTATLQQLFFTTLMRRYERSRIAYLQEYHWVFLAQSPTPPAQKTWQFAMMYSTIGPYPAEGRPPLAPRNSSEGSVAQAIRDWLRDCQTGGLPRKLPKPTRKTK
jgi:hypothetical protein